MRARTRIPRSSGDKTSIQMRADINANIRHTEALFRNLHPQRDISVSPQFTAPLAKVVGELSHQLAAVAFASIAFDDLAVYVVAIALELCVQILFDRNHHSSPRIRSS